MKRFYVIEDLLGKRVYLGDVEVSPLFCGNELTGNPFQPDKSFEYHNPVRNFLPVSFDIDPRFF